MRKILRKACLIMGMCLLVTSVMAVPAMAATYPCLFYGTAEVDGAPVAADTEVTAWVEGVQVGSALTGAGTLDPDKFTLQVELDGPAEVSFKIGELNAAETATWVQYGQVEVNLTAYTAPAPAELVSISAEPSELSLFIGDTAQLTVTAHYTVGADTDVTAYSVYESNNEAVATVDDSGLITAVSKGDANITISYPEGEVSQETSVLVSVVNQAPDAPTGPSPADEATSVPVSPELSVLVSDPDGDTMTVTFYDALDDSVIGTVEGVTSGNRAEVTWSGLSYGTVYSWYVQAGDGEATATSDPWSFTTKPVPNTMELVEGVNVVAYTGATTSLPDALSNIGPDGSAVVQVIWARADWTEGVWWQSLHHCG